MHKPKVKILVAYHKPFELLKDEILTPIHLGRALATQASKDGTMSEADYAWMCENMIGDDTGENISHLNRYFCELTGIYWAYKNYDKLGNPDFIGFMHYRRHFIFDKDDDTPSYEFSSCNYYEDGLYKLSLYEILKEYNIIASNPFKNDYQSVEEYYKSPLAVSEGHIAEDYDILRGVIAETKPWFLPFFNAYSSSHRHYAANMFLLARAEFFKYAEFMFDLIFEMLEKMKVYFAKRSFQENRVCAFFSERLSGAYLFSLLENKIKMAHIPRADIKIYEKYELRGIDFMSLREKVVNEICKGVLK